MKLQQVIDFMSKVDYMHDVVVELLPEASSNESIIRILHCSEGYPTVLDNNRKSLYWTGTLLSTHQFTEEQHKTLYSVRIFPKSQLY